MAYKSFISVGHGKQRHDIQKKSKKDTLIEMLFITFVPQTTEIVFCLVFFFGLRMLNIDCSKSLRGFFTKQLKHGIAFRSPQSMNMIFIPVKLR